MYKAKYYAYRYKKLFLKLIVDASGPQILFGDYWADVSKARIYKDN